MRYFWRLRHAPLSSTTPIAVIVCCLRGLSRLADRNPRASATIFAALSRAVHNAVDDHKCFVAKEVGNGFIIVAASHDAALHCAQCLARYMGSVEWFSFIEEAAAANRPAIRKKSNPFSEVDMGTSTSDSSVATTPTSKDVPEARCKNLQTASKRKVLRLLPALSLYSGLLHVNRSGNEVDYQGDTIDEAIAACDVCPSSNIVVTKTFSERASSQSNFFALDEYNPSKSSNSNRLLVLMHPGATREESLASLDDDCRNDDELMGDTLQAERGRLTSRRGIVVLVQLPPTAATDRGAHLLQLTSLLTTVDEHVKPSKGVLHYSSEGEILIGFNTTQSLPASSRRAVNMVLELSAALNKLEVTSPLCFPITMVVMDGNLIASAADLVIMGTCITTARQVASNSHVLSPQIHVLQSKVSMFCSAAIAVECEYFARSLAVGTVREESGVKSIFALISLLETQQCDQEWMYECASSDQANPFTDVNAAFVDFCKGVPWKGEVDRKAVTDPQVAALLEFSKNRLAQLKAF